MSKSIHITIKDFKGLTKEEIDKQASDPNSDLNKWSENPAAARLHRVVNEAYLGTRKIRAAAE